MSLHAAWLVVHDVLRKCLVQKTSQALAQLLLFSVKCMLMQVKARDETLAKDEERHQQLKEESKKQVNSWKGRMAGAAFLVKLHMFLQLELNSSVYYALCMCHVMS